VNGCGRPEKPDDCQEIELIEDACGLGEGEADAFAQDAFREIHFEDRSESKGLCPRIVAARHGHGDLRVPERRSARRRTCCRVPQAICQARSVPSVQILIIAIFLH